MNDFQKASQILDDVFWAGYHTALGSYPPGTKAKSQARLVIPGKLVELTEILGFSFARVQEGGNVVFPQEKSQLRLQEFEDLVVEIIAEFLRLNPRRGGHLESAFRSIASEIVGQAKRGKDWKSLVC